MSEVNYGLLSERRPPIAGPGSEVFTLLPARYGWCGYCGYTGRVLGPTQASCPERNGWHAWLRRCVDLHERQPLGEHPGDASRATAPLVQSKRMVEGAGPGAL